ncbi:TolC family protein [Chitinophaga pinensis]|uniref:Outer membrane efflux protein n=1 Tax=Chitinophaga pinensis (strain ATCC 43595 / DSM 2588 / LMG 13176 / NBRC 15968 / NCIMB 11800 / UQM 2034) TaxID=485918 RepID=A0A979GVL9_CHIPD|nr:TolC family protein [Chitinophaga pinensis]ACU61161.1 outer membrane efflux protein [Chitinophaga pinensis DSM 2588]
MKKGLFIIIGLLGCLFANAQRKETSLYIPLIDSPEVAQLKVVLVELAMQNPALKVHDAKLKVNKYETNKAKAGWLNMLQASGNLNEYTLKNNSNNATFFPRYNFSLTVPIGNLITIPNDVKIAKAEKKVIIAMKEEEQLKIKADVLNAYELYAANKKMMELEVPLLEDVYNHYKQTEEKFSSGDKDVSVETLNIAYRSYNEEMVRKVMLERDIRQAKIELERLIGVSFEEAVLQSQARTMSK